MELVPATTTRECAEMGIAPRETPITETPLNKDTFRDIYETYYRKVYNYIRYSVNNPCDCEELVSDVFERVIKNYSTYRPEVSPLEAWIIGISKNVKADYFRKQKPYSSLPIDAAQEQISDNHRPEEVVLMNEATAALLQAMSTLSDKERNIISMKFATDLKNCEIAKIIGISESNVGTIIHRTINKLRTRLGKEFGL